MSEEKGKLGLHGYFSTPIYSILVKDFENHQQGLIDYFTQLREKNEGVVRSNVRGWHSTEDLVVHEHTDVQWMVKKIRNIARTAAKHFHGERRLGMPELKACWANISDSGCWNAPHQHLPADWSGVLYIRAESEAKPAKNGIGEGDLMFFDPLPMGRRFDRNPTMTFRPVDGKLMIFPAYALHMVAPHFNPDPRISVSFNLFWQSPPQSQK